MTLALAMGADFLMLGRYFARFDEPPTQGHRQRRLYEGILGRRLEPRTQLAALRPRRRGKLTFEEGVDSYVTYAGSLHDNVNTSLYKVRSTMCNCGVLNIPDLQKNARLTVVSSTSIVEGGSHDVMLKNKGIQAE